MEVISRAGEGDTRTERRMEGRKGAIPRFLFPSAPSDQRSTRYEETAPPTKKESHSARREERAAFVLQNWIDVHIALSRQRTNVTQTFFRSWLKIEVNPFQIDNNVKMAERKNRRAGKAIGRRKQPSAAASGCVRNGNRTWRDFSRPPTRARARSVMNEWSADCLPFLHR